MTLSHNDIGTLIALVNQDRLVEAEQRAMALLGRYPREGMLWKIFGVTQARQGKDPLAAMQKTAELMPNDPEAHGNLGAVLHDQKLWEQALVSLRRALQLQPNDADALVNAADSLRELGRAAQAVPLYQRALKINPQQVIAQNDLGNVLLQLGEVEQAQRAYRLALRLKPEDAQVRFNLANAQRLAGNYAEALVGSQQALALDPALGAAYNNAGLSLVGLGRHEEAAGHFRRALASGPVSVDLLCNLGNTLRDMGDRREAAALYRQAIELDPAHVESHCNLGNMLFQMHRIDESAASYRRALALKPDHAAAHTSLAVVLRHQRRAAEAEASCRAALALDPNYAEALHVQGELRADRGEFADAEQWFRRAIAAKPDNAAAYSSISTHRKLTLNDQEWLQGAESLLAKRLPLEQQIGLYFSIGKYFDDTGQYDQAFSNYERANELTKRYGAVYDPVKLTARVDEIIGRLDPSLVQQRQPGASDSDLPVLVVGMPRSGTSLVEQILASHPSVHGAGEVTFWNSAFNAYRKAVPISGLAENYLERLTAGSGAAVRVVDKMPANFMHEGLVHMAFPRARIIHVRRDPLDTCLSIYFQNFFNMGPHGNDLVALAHYYREYRRLTDYWRGLLPKNSLIEISYEALIEDQEGQSRRMLEFIGLPWDPRTLDFYKTDRLVLTASRWQVRQKIHGASAGRWRNYEKYIGPLQVALGDILADAP